MKPTEEPAKAPLINDVNAPAKSDASQPKPESPVAADTVAEPPKNLEFTEVPVGSDASIADKAATEDHTPGSGADSPKPGGVPQTATPVKPAKQKGRRKPMGAIILVLLVFAGLAAVAYIAYTKSK